MKWTGKINLAVSRWLIVLAAIVFLLLTSRLFPRIITLMDKTPPLITVWNGTRQEFGQQGLAQRWVNVLGNVSDPEIKIDHLSYTLNGGPSIRLRMGPDGRRLVQPGDFNIEIDPAELREGNNQLVITSTNGSNLGDISMVTVIYHHSHVSLPYEVDWSKVSNPQQVLQIVDGRWQLAANGIRPIEIGYDRMLAVGDSTWTNYQVTVPVTVNAIDAAGFHAKNSGEHAGISIDLRWLGHSDDPAQCPPPHCGWNPVGNFAKYFFKENGANYLGLKVKEKEPGFPTLPYQFKIGHTYIFKTSVQTTSQGNLYRMSVWEKDVDPEPSGWMFERLAALGDGNPDHGAFALVAHYTDVTFGNISVTPLP